MKKLLVSQARLNGCLPLGPFLIKWVWLSYEILYSHKSVEKYGGLEKATQAAIKIQQSWRQFKLRTKFQRIKQQNKSQQRLQLRKRAQSIRDPRRRLIITKKRNIRVYHREANVPYTEQKTESGVARVAAGQAKAKVSPTEQNRKRAIGINHFNRLALLFTYTMYISDIFDNYYDSNICICQALLILEYM